MLLQSAEPREQAWGAWLAGQHRMHDMSPLLELVVRNHVSEASPASLDFALDALIQLDATLPPELLEPLAADRPAQTLLLLSRAGGAADEVLLSLLSRERGLPWFASANLLLARKPAGLAAKLLEGFTIEAALMISDDGNLMAGRGRAGGVTIGCGGASSQPGMPPWPSYRLTPSARSGAVVLADGPTPIYYERRVSQAGEGPPAGGVSYEAPSSAERLDYVVRLTGLHSPPIRAHEDRSVAARGPDDLTRESTAFRHDIERRYAQFLQMLIADGVLNDDEAAALPLQLEMTVIDRRSASR